ncbi:polyprenyl diphosphate synthase [bacterium]|nr:polyprenyl diphosphate synthase [bacterium]
MLSKYFTKRARSALRKKKIPQHIAIIMDGNGRWAKKRMLSRLRGHAKGADALKKAIEESIWLGVKYLSVYAFSSENWKRPKSEIEGLMKLFVSSLKNELPNLMKNKIQVEFMGDLSKFSSELKAYMKKTVSETKLRKKNLQLNVMINYGSKAEIVRAVNSIIKSKQQVINEKTIDKYLYTAGLPDPDLLIRTSGEYRLSNFLLWQSAYTEFWYTKKYWPDFNGKLLRQAVKSYQKRNKRLGGL